MARSPFIWGQSGQKMTPEQVARQRDVALALMGRGADFSPAKGGFYEALGRGLQGWASGRMNKLAREAEAEGMSAADERWQQLSGALGQSEAPAIAPQGFGISEPSQSPNAEGIRLGLIARGLPEHVADAFVMNFQDESGLNPGINEQKPIVPGSRGGFGLAQWTGPRRRQLEEFAAQRGTPVSDMDTQLDFLMTELSGPERAAAQKIMASADTPTAAAAIVNSFLRPAEEHRARREANYLGGSGGSYTQPSAQNVGALAAAMGDPWFAQQYGPVAEALMGQQMQMQSAAYRQQLAQQDPAYQLGLERAQLELDAMRNPAPKEPVFKDGVWWDQNTYPPTPITERAVDDSSKEQQIARIMEDGVPRNIAIGIVDGRYRTDRHPITGELQVVDMATGEIKYGSKSTPDYVPAGTDGSVGPSSVPPAQQQTQEDAASAFGLAGAGASAINRVSDALGLGYVYPDVAQAQADFSVLRESITNDISEGYGRQPPSWLLKDIRDLAPTPGSPFQGAKTAQSKLISLKSKINGEIVSTEQELTRTLSPAGRQELEARLHGQRMALGRIDGMLSRFASDDAPAEGQTPQGSGPQPGTIEDGYRFKGGDPSDPNNWEAVQ